MATLYEKMRAASISLKTKAEIVDYYRAHYPDRGRGGEPSWKQALVRTLSAMTGQKTKTLEKRFDAGPKGRLNDPEPRNAGQYAELGQFLPPKVPPKGYKITGTLYILYSECEPCIGIEFYVRGADAIKFRDKPSVQGLINVYNKVPYDKKTNIVEPCAQETGQDIQVEGLGKEE